MKETQRTKFDIILTISPFLTTFQSDSLSIMEKLEYRAVIKFFYLKGKTPIEIKVELDSVYGDAAPSFTTVKTWVAEFKRGRTSIFDEERSGRPKTATTDEMIDYVHQMIDDRDR
jgi:histone-lysine N-methyltransferase SETMAR